MKFLRDNAHCKHDAKEDFAVITGSQTITAVESSEEWETTGFSIDYPEGFNYNNSIVLTIGKSRDLEYWYEYNYGESGKFNWLEVSVTLSNKINFNVTRKIDIENEDFDLYYKIVLMKIS